MSLAARNSYPSDVRLLERERPLDVLDDRTRRAVAGHGSVVLVAGEAGIGKTVLLRALVERARARTSPLWGMCDSLSTPRPLGPLRDVAGELGAPVTDLLRGSAAQHEIFAAVLDALRVRPRVFVVEDLHWADEATCWSRSSRDFLPCSYGFRPQRRAHDAVAEVRHLTSHSYEWVVEGDITACFDEISHPALMERVRERVGDKRVLALVKAFLKAGILGEDRVLRATNTGTPQGSILSPLLSNVAFSVLDEHIARPRAAPRPARTNGPSAAPRACPTIALSAMRTTGAWSSPARGPTPKPCGRRWRRSCPRWVCACRSRRP